MLSDNALWGTSVRPGGRREVVKVIRGEMAEGNIMEVERRGWW